MDIYTIVIVLVAAFCVGKQILAVVGASGKIEIPGRLAGYTGIRVMAVGVAVFAVLGWKYVVREPLIYAALVALVVSFLFGRAGLNKKGCYYNGQSVAYGELEYYMVIREFKNGFTLRLHTRKGRDYIILFHSDQRETVIKCLEDAGVRDWDSFTL